MSTRTDGPWTDGNQNSLGNTSEQLAFALQESLAGALAVLRLIVWGPAAGLRRALPSRPLASSGLPGLFQRFHGAALLRARFAGTIFLCASGRRRLKCEHIGAEAREHSLSRVADQPGRHAQPADRAHHNHLRFETRGH